MKRALLIFLLVFLFFGAILAIAWFVPMPLEPFLDFQVLYRADSGILRGVPLYDLAGQKQMVADDLGVGIERVFVLPFPYPPWYALATLPLALLSIHVAVRMWFLLNVTMLLLSAWFISDGWDPRSRLISFVAAPLFFPTFGALIVGQYVFPTILGMAMLIYALRKQNVTVLALGAALTTFKPHVGVFVLLAVTLHLLIRRDDFGRRALWYLLVTGALLFFLGFLADGNWLVNYFKSLFAFKDVSECKLCVSLPVVIANIAGFGFDQAFIVSLVLLIGFAVLFSRLFPQLTDGRLVGLFTCVALLVNPYLQNYDFAFAIIPLFVCAGFTPSRLARFAALVAFLLPWIGFALWGRDGNFMLILSTVVLMVGLARKTN